MGTEANKPADSTFKITVVTGPRDELDMTHVLNLVKPALLYADHVILHNWQAASLALLQDLSEASFGEKVRGLKTLAPPTGQHHSALERLERLRQRDPSSLASEELSDLLCLQDMVDPMIAGGAEDLARQPGADEILAARNAGLLEIRRFPDPQGGDAYEYATTMLLDYYTGILETISAGDCFPLLDAGAGESLTSMIDQGQATVSQVKTQGAGGVALAGDLIQALPQFHHATVAEISEIRRELEPHLGRFRSGMLGFAKEMSSVPWNRDFRGATNFLYHEKVAPAIQEIEEQVRANTYLSKLAGALYDKSAWVPGSTIGIAMASLDHVLGGVFALVGATGIAAIKARKEWRKRQAEIESNQLYFLYEADKRLSKARG